MSYVNRVAWVYVCRWNVLYNVFALQAGVLDSVANGEAGSRRVGMRGAPFVVEVQRRRGGEMQL